MYVTRSMCAAGRLGSDCTLLHSHVSRVHREDTEATLCGHSSRGVHGTQSSPFFSLISTLFFSRYCALAKLKVTQV